MQTTINDKGVLTKEFKITFSKEEVNKKYQEKLNQIAPTVEMPGYRKGKVSPRVVEMKYKSSILEEVQKDLAQAGIAHISKEFKAYGDFDFPQFGEVKLNSEFSYQVVTSLFPDIQLPEYKGLKIKSEEPEVKDEDIDKVIQTYLGQKSDPLDMADDAICEDQDMVNFSYSVKIDKQEVKVENNAFSPADLILINGAEVEESSKKALIGSKKGDIVQISVTLSNVFEPKEFQGKKANVSITILGLKRNAPAVFNDEFAQQLGIPSASKMKELISQQMLNEKKIAIQNKNREKLLIEISSKVNFEIPEKLLNTTLKNQKQEQAHNQEHVHDENCDHDHDHDHSHDHHHEEHVHGENCDHSHDEHDHDHGHHHDHGPSKPVSEEETKENLKKQIILEMIANNESINVTEEDFNRYIQKLASMYNMKPKDLAGRITDKMAMDISREIRLNKALDIVSSSAITEAAK
jgi:trigger factor